MNTFIRLLYSLLIAAAVVTFVAVGMNTFYPEPTAPTYPIMPLEKSIAQPAGTPAPNSNVEQLYQQRQDKYQADLKAYQRNVSIILSVLAAGIVAFGLWFKNRSEIIGEGVALGGIGTSIYAVGTAVASNDRIMRFVAVTLFLTSVLVVVYFKFNDSAVAKKTPAKRA